MLDNGLAWLAITNLIIGVLAAIPHEQKLRTGHLRGNRFRLRVRGATPREWNRRVRVWRGW